MPTPVRIWLLGLMAAGKSTVGRELAGRLGWPYLDNDLLLAQQTGRVLADWPLGPQLHAAELQLAWQLAERPPPFVAGIPASLGDQPAQLDRLAASGFVVLLTAPVEQLLARAVGTGRPLGEDAAQTLRQQEAARLPELRRVADLTVDTVRSTPATVVSLVLAALPR